MKNKLTWSCMLAVVAVGFTSYVNAEGNAGKLMVAGGLMKIVPDDDSGDLTAPSFPGTKANALSAPAQVIITPTYMLTNNVSLSMPLTTPFRHRLLGDGAINGVGSIGEVKVLPMTLFTQYRFAIPETTPYVGLGLTYAYFYKTQGTAALSALTGGAPTTFTVDSKLAVTPQVGLTVDINKQWYLDFMYARTFLKTKARLSTGQMLQMTLDPNIYSFQIGYRF